MNNFKIGVKGRIIQDRTYDNHVGWNIMIEDDTKGKTGGYFIYIIHPKKKGWGYVFDTWVEKYEYISTNLADYDIKWD